MTIADKEKKKYLVAVYGTLRKGGSNYPYYLMQGVQKGTIKSLMTTQTKPEYTMFSLGLYPALLERGTTSVTIEVFEVEEQDILALDNLEGYLGKNNPGNMYNRSTIETAYGRALIYIYNNDKLGLISDANKVIHGDWLAHLDLLKVT